MKKLISVLSLSALLLASCSKSSSPTSTNNNNNGNGNGGAGMNQIVATVNGTAVTFKTLGAAGNGTYVGGAISFAIAGLDSATGETISIGGGGLVGTGTFDLGLQHTTQPIYGFGLTYSNVDANKNTIHYGTNSSTKAGSIIISSISSTGAQGTFSATLPQTNPADPTKTVSITNGGFNVVF